MGVAKAMCWCTLDIRGVHIARIKGWSHSPSVIWNRCTEALPPISLLLSLYLPACASEQGNVIGSVHMYIYICVYKKNCN